jgi:hypothetical protein
VLQVWLLRCRRSMTSGSTSSPIASCCCCCWSAAAAADEAAAAAAVPWLLRLVTRPSVVCESLAPAGRRPGLEWRAFVCGSLRPGWSRDPPSGLGGAGEGDWRSVVAGVLVSDVLAELKGGIGREDGAKGKKLLWLMLVLSLKRGVEKASRQGARSRSRPKSSSGEEKLECSQY